MKFRTSQTDPFQFAFDEADNDTVIRNLLNNEFFKVINRPSGDPTFLPKEEKDMMEYKTLPYAPIIQQIIGQALVDLQIPFLFKFSLRRSEETGMFQATVFDRRNWKPEFSCFSLNPFDAVEAAFMDVSIFLENLRNGEAADTDVWFGETYPFSVLFSKLSQTKDKLVYTLVPSWFSAAEPEELSASVFEDENRGRHECEVKLHVHELKTDFNHNLTFPFNQEFEGSYSELVTVVSCVFLQNYLYRLSKIWEQLFAALFPVEI
jgi:hypothetical protein